MDFKIEHQNYEIKLKFEMNANKGKKSQNYDIHMLQLALCFQAHLLSTIT